ncbi:hypothetical protein ACLMAJ_09065 [Nocardia sp. KC 131]|uniref:hypothetical protein n=1 Tax=Nocardia arseniciresistens TaxID=3392119 RepID=UPI00398E6F30
MRTIPRLAVTVVGALVAIALTIGFAATASAEPAESADPIAATAPAQRVESPGSIVAASASEPTPHATDIGQCLPPGDTIELRTALGVVLGTIIGGIVGLPVFVFGAIPGAVIGGILGYFIGSTSYAIDSGHLKQQGLC